MLMQNLLRRVEQDISNLNRLHRTLKEPLYPELDTAWLMSASGSQAAIFADTDPNDSVFQKGKSTHAPSRKSPRILLLGRLLQAVSPRRQPSLRTAPTDVPTPGVFVSLPICAVPASDLTQYSLNR